MAERWTVTCPNCGSRSPWTLPGVGVLVRCVEPQITRQIRRDAKRQGVDPVSLAPICGSIFYVKLPVAA